ncbi:hypothetical protein BC628DRAFT_1406171 [Trametes gibbosa]|nr:hypothetical protein BC628DRAFT_1406171 [Trametes gibbosa]
MHTNSSRVDMMQPGTARYRASNETRSGSSGREPSPATDDVARSHPSCRPSLRYVRDLPASLLGGRSRTPGRLAAAGSSR